MQINELLTLLDRHPDYARLLGRVVAAEEAEIARCRDRTLQEWERLREDGLPEFFGVERRELGVRQGWLDQLTWEDAIELVSTSRTHTTYRLVDRGLVKRGLAAWSQAGPEADEEATEIPDDLFIPIAGHEEAKRLLTLAIAAPRPVHMLLLGAEPATAKTLFLEELRRLPRALYADGGLATKAGIVETLLAASPQYLLIDQVDHLAAEDQQALHGVMASGRVARLRYRQHQDEQRLVWVFASANSARRLSESLLDRFQVVTFRPYSEEEFASVCRHFLVKRERTDAALAAHIARRLAGRTRSVRAAQRVARLAASVAEVDELVEMLTFPGEHLEERSWSAAPQRGRRR